MHPPVLIGNSLHSARFPKGHKRTPTATLGSDLLPPRSHLRSHRSADRSRASAYACGVRSSSSTVIRSAGRRSVTIFPSTLEIDPTTRGGLCRGPSPGGARRRWPRPRETRPSVTDLCRHLGASPLAGVARSSASQARSPRRSTRSGTASARRRSPTTIRSGQCSALLRRRAHSRDHAHRASPTKGGG